MWLVLIFYKKRKKVLNHNPPFRQFTIQNEILIVEYTVLFPLFERCTCKWINVVQCIVWLRRFIRRCITISRLPSSLHRYHFAVRCIDASLTPFPRITNSRSVLEMAIAPCKSTSYVSTQKCLCIRLKRISRPSCTISEIIAYKNKFLQKKQNQKIIIHFLPPIIEINFYHLMSSLIVILVHLFIILLNIINEYLTDERYKDAIKYRHWKWMFLGNRRWYWFTIDTIWI